MLKRVSLVVILLVVLVLEGCSSGGKYPPPTGGIQLPNSPSWVSGSLKFISDQGSRTTVPISLEVYNGGSDSATFNFNYDNNPPYSWEVSNSITLKSKGKATVNFTLHIPAMSELAYVNWVNTERSSVLHTLYFTLSGSNNKVYNQEDKEENNE